MYAEGSRAKSTHASRIDTRSRLERRNDVRRRLMGRINVRRRLASRIDARPRLASGNDLLRRLTSRINVAGSTHTGGSRAEIRAAPDINTTTSGRMNLGRDTDTMGSILMLSPRATPMITATRRRGTGRVRCCPHRAGAGGPTRGVTRAI